MTDGGEFCNRVTDEAGPELAWAWEPLVDSDDQTSALPFNPERDPEDDEAPIDTDSALPEDIWGDEPAVRGPTELEFPADAQLDDIWSLGQDNGDEDLDDGFVFAPSRGNVDGLTVGASSVTNPGVRPVPRRPTLAPAPVPDGRRSRLRQVIGRLQAAPRVAALALALVAIAGLFLALAARRPDTPPVNASQRIDATGLQPTSTMPMSTVPRAPSTTLTTLAPPSPPPSIGGEAPPTTMASPAAPATAATTPVTTAAPRPPARPEVTTATVAAPPGPQPAPTPTATVAPSPPETIVLPPPDATVTTRRPRSTVPETTVPETTIASSTTVPRSADSP